VLLPASLENFFYALFSLFSLNNSYGGVFRSSVFRKSGCRVSNLSAPPVVIDYCPAISRAPAISKRNSKKLKSNISTAKRLKTRRIKPAVLHAPKLFQSPGTLSCQQFSGPSWVSHKAVCSTNLAEPWKFSNNVICVFAAEIWLEKNESRFGDGGRSSRNSGRIRVGDGKGRGEPRRVSRQVRFRYPKISTLLEQIFEYSLVRSFS